MSKDLVPIAANALPTLSPGLDVFKDIVQNSTFLQRVQLFTKGRYIDSGIIPPGHYGVPVDEETIEDLGTEIDLIPLAWRAKAIDMNDRDAIIVNYDSDSDEYKRIRATADNETDSHCMYGPTFLIYERSTGKFYELFFGNASARRESSKLLGFCAISPYAATELSKQTGKKVEARGPLPCTLKAKYITKGTWGWHVPACHQCSIPFDNLPDIKVILDEITKFYSLKTSEVEKVEEPVKKRAR